ncbi:periplasmic heavy metal sensor [Novosphingobium album (ex Liu et al. 2023)]|uniref:Periplasmic heavy metal sensor n=1 Tax=Novosphingobium album (ex Liu et al. 2023) TaxID=3031130 RepID=A0ABT5WV65_9SPHN|nr:periplasmic heavy metal sensor [Novosphingobium album (ex Liu et al. 2023)]MDE8653800.1 periplasmic heavy metal sensor [Novosphingobium album (ex Liu et al. 2023)]
MKLSGLHIVLAVLLAVAAGCLGAMLAVQWGGAAQRSGLHEFVHDKLDLSPDQTSRLDQLEARFATERAGHEARLRAANADLAAAMEQEHNYGPKVGAAIDRVHLEMGELQKATVRHVFAMRVLLNEGQRRKFDRQISISLTGDGRE